jgi:hypothetical protein
MKPSLFPQKISLLNSIVHIPAVALPESGRERFCASVQESARQYCQLYPTPSKAIAIPHPLPGQTVQGKSTEGHVPQKQCIQLSEAWPGKCVY